ncbi:MAG: hypothetical protein IPF95_12135 [Flavobacteriales bacterium]|nr:hypothetical protein [Flavobacteriales bacterium]MBK6945967.1 hypothetical protein [Flavobacteriales bacterium]HQV52511.1 hypothetical protein [Flavobacteriales bacterium]
MLEMIEPYAPTSVQLNVLLTNTGKDQPHTNMEILKKTISALAVALLICSTAAQAQYNTANLTPVVGKETNASYTCEKLRLYPIIANDVFREAHKDIGQSVPMNKALADGRLKVSEKEGGGTVNTLQAKNTSTDTIYLMQGEVVVGGKQDRMLAQDVLIPPGATMDIGAFCVEHGRWSEGGTGKGFNNTAGVVPQEVRKAAAVQKDQSEVWDKVAKNVAKHDANAPSGSYVDVTRDEKFAKAQKQYKDRLGRLPQSVKHIVGVVAVTGDRVVGCDVFATEDMFAQAFPQLIDAYIAEALSNGSEVTMSDAAIQEYFKELFENEKALEEKTNGNGYLFKQEGKTYRISSF